MSRLKSSCGSALEVTRAPNDFWQLTAKPGLTAKVMAQALVELDKELKRGPQKDIGDAILELLGATDRPPQLDEEKAAMRTIALTQMAWDYPIDVVKRACRNWRKVPNYGRWWPTEQDLRAQCEPLYADDRALRNQAEALHLRLKAEEEARSDRASYFAGSKHNDFRSRMAAVLLPDQMRTYFDAGQIRYVETHEVHVRTAVALDVMERYGRDIIRELGIILKHEPSSFLRERNIQLVPTPEEDAEVSRKMTRLNQAVAKGECIENLRRSGEL